MRCRSALILITKQLREPLNPAQTLELDRHLERCAACRAERAAVTEITARLAQARPTAAAVPIRVPELNRLVERPAFDRLGANKMTLRLVTGLTATAILSIGLLTLPSRRTPSMAAVRARLQQVHTWHLHGWKLVNGKQIPWEVWGRTRPFFYREQLGNEVTYDDGVQRLYLLPADPAAMQEKGMLFRTPSQPDRTDNALIGFTSSFKDWPKERGPVRQVADSVVFSEQDPNTASVDHRTNEYTVSKSTWLPTSFDQYLATPQQKVLTEHLDVEYDAAELTEVTVPPQPGNSISMDAAQALDPEMPTENVESANGVTAQLTPLAMDRSGVVLARVRAWMGRQQIKGHGFILQVAPMSTPQRYTLGYAADDNYRQPYLFAGDSALLMMATNILESDRLILLAPLHPYRPGQALPHQLDVKLTVAPCATGYRSGPDNAVLGQQIVLASAKLEWTLPLPNQIQPINLDPYLPAHWRGVWRKWQTPAPNVEQMVQEARAHWREYSKR
jgi:hypothetical protein